MGIAKNSLLGRWLGQFKHPLILEYLSSSAFLDWVQEVKDLYWAYFKESYPTRTHHKAWTVTREGFQVTWTWYDLFEFRINYKKCRIQVFSIGDDWKMNALTDRATHTVALLNSKGRMQSLADQAKKNWTQKRAIKELRKRHTLPQVMDIEEHDDAGNLWVESRPIVMEIKKLKSVQELDTGEGDIFYMEQGEFENMEWKVHNLLYREACLKWFKKTPDKLITRVWRHFIFEILDREIVSLVTKARGPFASIYDYQEVWRNQEAYREVAKVAPGLTPFIHTLKLKRGMGQRFMRAIKRALKQQGITRSGWKTLIKLPVGVAQDMAGLAANVYHAPVYGHEEDYTPRSNDLRIRKVNLANMASMANFLAKVGVMPRMTSFRWVAQYFPDHAVGNFDWAVPFYRALFRATKRARISHKWHLLHHGDYGEQPGAPRYWRERVHMVMDWLRNAEEPFTREQLRMPFTGWERMCAEWHDNVQHTNFMQRYGKQSWDSLLDNYTHESYPDHVAIALTTTETLSQEGIRMHHCVGSYVPYCTRGHSRIFSVMKGDKPVSTLEIGIQSKAETEIGEEPKWVVRQHYQLGNKRVELDEACFASLLCDEYDHLYQKALEAGTVKLPEGRRYDYFHGGGGQAPF